MKITKPDLAKLILDLLNEAERPKVKRYDFPEQTITDRTVGGVAKEKDLDHPLRGMPFGSSVGESPVEDVYGIGLSGDEYKSGQRFKRPYSVGGREYDADIDPDPWTMATRGVRVPEKLVGGTWQSSRPSSETRPTYTDREMEAAMGISGPQKLPQIDAASQFPEKRKQVELGHGLRPKRQAPKTEPETPLPVRRETSPVINPTALNLAKRAATGTSPGEREETAARVGSKIKQWAGPESKPARKQAPEEREAMLSKIRGPGRTVRESNLEISVDDLKQVIREELYALLNV